MEINTNSTTSAQGIYSVSEKTTYHSTGTIIVTQRRWIISAIWNNNDHPNCYYPTAATVDTKETKTTDESDVDTAWKVFQRKSSIDTISRQQQQEQQDTLFPWVGCIQTGRWAYVDGNLLLAADRIIDTISTNQQITTNGGTTTTPSYRRTLSDGTISTSTAKAATTVSNGGGGDDRRIPTVFDQSKDDTLLKGRVIATYQTRLDDNPILSASSSSSSSVVGTTINTTMASTSNQENQSSSTGSSSSRKVIFDTHLSVPRGSIHIGKFMYPKHHPSFFDQPMFQPMKMGSFTLRQVLGNLNTAAHHPSSINNKMIVVAKQEYQRSDFYNKTFLLTSRPLQQFSNNDNDNNKYNRGEKRWSIKYNEYVYDTPSSNKKKTNALPSSDVPTSAVRVLQIVFHTNNTFSTTGGLGTAAILRGKFDIIGTNNDHLWMQVIRFGFGRSVSGSVYSEGPMLSHEDIKAYWGSIHKFPKAMATETNNTNTTNSSILSSRTTTTTTEEDVGHRNISSVDDTTTTQYRIEVEGSVLDGLGLEPMPVARFMLREIDTLLDDDTEDDDDDDDVDEEDTTRTTIIDTVVVVRQQDGDDDDDDDGIDWTTTTANDSFQ